MVYDIPTVHNVITMFVSHNNFFPSFFFFFVKNKLFALFKNLKAFPEEIYSEIISFIIHTTIRFFFFIIKKDNLWLVKKI